MARNSPVTCRNLGVCAPNADTLTGYKAWGLYTVISLCHLKLIVTYSDSNIGKTSILLLVFLKNPHSQIWFVSDSDLVIA